MKQGFYPNISHEDYHADEFGIDQPTLSSSMVKILLAKSPKHAWGSHPKLGNKIVPDTSKAMDIGSAAHDLIAGDPDKIVYVDAPSWAHKAPAYGQKASLVRAELREQGKIAMLESDREPLAEMVQAIAAQCALLPEDARPLNGGCHEGTLFWYEGDIPCKARPDWCDPNGPELLWDWKIGDTAKPQAFKKQIANMQYDVSRSWYLRGARKVFGWRNPEMYFLRVESAWPYSMSVNAINRQWGDVADRKIDHALRIWSECMTLNHWPAYKNKVYEHEMPNWAYYDWEEVENAESAGEGVLKSAYDWQKPL